LKRHQLLRSTRGFWQLLADRWIQLFVRAAFCHTSHHERDYAQLRSGIALVADVGWAATGVVFPLSWREFDPFYVPSITEEIHSIEFIQALD